MKSLRTLSIVFALVAVPSLALAGGNEDAAAAHKAERQARHAEKLEKFDTNNDGKLDATERDAMHEARADARFDKLDSNGDGKITRAEFKAGAEIRRDRKHGKRGKGMKRGKRGDHAKGARNVAPARGKLVRNGRLLDKVTKV